MRQNFVVQFIKVLKHWLCDVQSGIAMEKWTLSVDQCWLQVLQFSVHLIDLLSTLLRCNGFARIQKAVVAQTGCRPPTVTMTLFLVKVWLWEVLWSFFLVQPLTRLSYEIHFSLNVTIWLKNGLLLLPRIREDDTSKQWLFFFLLICGPLMRHQLIELFHLSNLLQILNNHKMVNIEFFGNFSCSCKRISFSDPLNWSLSTFDGQPLCSSSSRLSFPLKNFLNYHCTVRSLAVPGSNVLLVLQVVSAAFWSILNSN